MTGHSGGEVPIKSLSRDIRVFTILSTPTALTPSFANNSYAASTILILALDVLVVKSVKIPNLGSIYCDTKNSALTRYFGIDWDQFWGNFSENGRSILVNFQLTRTFPPFCQVGHAHSSIPCSTDERSRVGTDAIAYA